jgi:myo-inositol-1(or 4)-monophosphatase
LDLFWEHIFSEDEAQVRTAWASLGDDERASVRDLLQRITQDAERVAEQRRAARFALNVLQPGPAPASAIAPAEPTPTTTPSPANEPSDTSPLLLGTGATDSTSAMPDFLDEALAFARELAHCTGERLKHASGQLIASTKNDGTLVTASDIEADQRMGEAILARYPDHGVLSEEGEKVYRGQEWCWVIDPIDGTTNFAWGFPAWGVLIGLLHHGTPVIGVAEFPPVGQQFYARLDAGTRAIGAWRKTEIGYGDGPIHTAADTALSSTQLFAIGTRSLKQGIPNIPCKLRLPGSSGFDLALLACGACVGVYDSSVHVWDVAALWPIIEAAGGQVVTNRVGGVFPLQVGVDYSSVVFGVLGAGSAELLPALLASFGDRFSVSR